MYLWKTGLIRQKLRFKMKRI